MQLSAGIAESGKLNFGRGHFILQRKMKRPLTEKILIRFPKLASALGNVGARASTPDLKREPGRLAAVMKASDSIDYTGKARKSFQFYIRPMS